MNDGTLYEVSNMLQCDQRRSKDNVDKYKGEFIVQNEKGLHTRPSTELVKCACKFESQINLVLDDTAVNAKSILGILMLAACQGTKLKIEAFGKDCKQAVEAIIALSLKKFNINY